VQYKQKFVILYNHLVTMTQMKMSTDINESNSDMSDSEEIEDENLSEVDNDVEDDRVIDSDEELQEAFAAGLLKPGLNTVVEKSERKLTNNVAGLKQKTEELAAPLKKLPWIEKLDHVVLKLAPLAPELALKEAEHEKARQKILKSSGISNASTHSDAIHNDFKRELTFYRQAQATVLEILPRLKSMGVPTKRPEDYFAQMAKTDDHMNKIRAKLVSKQATEERLEKVRKLRELKKFGKKVQQEVNVKRAKEKREMLDQVKKFRKGQGGNLDFLNKFDGDDDVNQDGPAFKRKKGSNPSHNNNKRQLEKRNYKEKKFGFGGKKKGSKMNNKESVNDISDYKRPKLPGAKGNKPGSKGAKPKGGKNKRNQRYGKMRRQKTKGKK